MPHNTNLQITKELRKKLASKTAGAAYGIIITMKFPRRTHYAHFAETLETFLTYLIICRPRFPPSRSPLLHLRFILVGGKPSR